MGKKSNIHEVRDFFPNRNLTEGAIIKEQSDGTAVISRATIIKAGLSYNRNNYLPEVLQRAVPLFENIQIRTDHPQGDEQHSVNSVVGRISNVWWNPSDKKIQADIKFSSTEDKLLTKIREGLIGDLSMNARGETELERGSDGKVFRNVKEIEKVWSVDLVTDASAGGTVNADLHESHRRVMESCQRMVEQMSDLENITLEEFQKARPDLVEQLQGSRVNENENEGISSDDVKNIIKDTVSSILTETFKERDRKQEEKEAAIALDTAIKEAVIKVLDESNVDDDIKNFIGTGLFEYARKTFDSIDKIDEKALSEKREELFDEFKDLAGKLSEGAGNQSHKTGNDGKIAKYLFGLRGV